MAASSVRERDAAILAEFQRGDLLRDIAARHGITKEWVRQIAAKHGLAPRAHQFAWLRSEEVRRAREIWNAYGSIDDIASELFISVPMAWKRLRQAGIVDYRAPLTRARAAAAIALYRAGLTYREIAARLGLCRYQEAYRLIATSGEPRTRCSRPVHQSEAAD